MGSEILFSALPGEKMLLLGNEAIARGVVESGVQVIAAYPGTPSSEIVDSLSRHVKGAGYHVEWSTNEKVAFECCVGAAFLGVRSFSAMKSVGLNVAMDPLMVVTLTGVPGGFVFVVADDPNCWSTQNEQDSRLLAGAAEVPCLEPASPQEAKDMVVYAYRLSERIGRAVMIRTVTRLNHCRASVTVGSCDEEVRAAEFKGVRGGFPSLPKHKLLHEEKNRLNQALTDFPFNHFERKKQAQMAVIAPGNAANYAREGISILGFEEKVSFLKLGIVNPLPEDLIRRILSDHHTVVVLEEIEPFVEEKVRGLCYHLPTQPRIVGKLSGDIEVAGEMTIEKAVSVLSAAAGLSFPHTDTPSGENINDLILDRDLVLCSGCPHMGTFYAIRKATKGQKTRVLIAGDIGCYGLGLAPPYSLYDSHLCMGASIGMANGYAATGYEGPIVAVIGDSTFYHSGISSLVNAVFNQHNVTVIVLDNSVIGMTGHQPSPGTGVTADGRPAPKLDIGHIARACGVQYVDEIDPFQLDAAAVAVLRAISHPGPSMVIARGECAIIAGRREKRSLFHIDPEECDACGRCANLLSCPALSKSSNGYSVNDTLCVGCGLCAQVCRKGAVRKKEQP